MSEGKTCRHDRHVLLEGFSREKRLHFLCLLLPCCFYHLGQKGWKLPLFIVVDLITEINFIKMYAIIWDVACMMLYSYNL